MISVQGLQMRHLPPNIGHLELDTSQLVREGWRQDGLGVTALRVCGQQGVHVAS